MKNKVMVPWCDVTVVTVAKDTLQTPLVTLWDAPTLWSPQKTTCGNSGLPLHKHTQKREHTHFWAISLVSNFLHLQKVNKLKELDEPIGLYVGIWWLSYFVGATLLTCFCSFRGTCQCKCLSNYFYPTIKGASSKRTKCSLNGLMRINMM